jgi:hypothetical protein
MRTSFAFASLVLLGTAACGDDGPPDDPEVTGFDVRQLQDPEVGGTTKANMDEDEIGEANWDCLGTPSDDEAHTVAITLTGVLNDFQTESTELRDATVEVFEGTDYQNPIDEFGPTAVDGVYSLDLPAGGTRWGFKVTQEDYTDTFLLNQYFDPSTAAQMLNISAISEGLTTALPAIIGLVREPGSGVLAGAIRDCDGNEVSHALATVSATPGEIDHLTGADTYYLDSGAGLPVRHDQLAQTDTNGLFAVFQLPASAEAFIQIWGFIDEADIAEGEAGLTLLAELPSPVVADTVITGSIEPLRN